MRKLHRMGAALAVLGGAVLVGCGGPRELPQVDVKGQVMLDGKPMKEGVISFAQPGQVPDALDVSNGEFAGKAKTGEAKVEIRAYREGKVPPGATVKQAVKENYVAEKYNTKSTMKAAISGKGIDPARFEVTSR